MPRRYCVDPEEELPRRLDLPRVERYAFVETLPYAMHRRIFTHAPTDFIEGEAI